MQEDSQILDNGLRVAFANLPSSNQTAIHIAVRAAPLYEEKRHCGVSHLLEHLHALQGMGNGTAELPGSDLLRTSSSFQAWVELDTTNYSISVNERDVVEACQHLVRSLGDLNFSEGLIAQEKRVIASEVAPNRGHTSSSELFQHLFRKSPFGYPTGGYRRTLKNLSKSDIQAYDARFYTPENFSVAIVGQTSPKMRDEIGDLLGAIESRKARKLEKPAPIPPHAADVKTRREAIGQCVLIFSVPDSISYEELLALRICAYGLSLSSSPLYESMRGKRHCFYEHGFMLEYPGEWATFILHCNTQAKEQPRAIKAMAQAIASITSKSSKDAVNRWLEDARSKFLNILKLNSESSTALASCLAIPYVASSDMLSNDLQKQANLARVLTVEEMRAAATKYFNHKSYFAVCDPFFIPLRSFFLKRALHKTLSG